MNRAIIYELMDEMDRMVGLLAEMQDVTLDDFVADPHRHLFAERALQIAIQCMINASAYTAAHMGWRKPEHLKDLLFLMGSRGLLPKPFAERVSGLAGLRNVLVHAYQPVNREMVYEVIHRLDDFREFARYMLKFVNAHD